MIRPEDVLLAFQLNDVAQIEPWIRGLAGFACGVVAAVAAKDGGIQGRPGEGAAFGGLGGDGGGRVFVVLGGVPSDGAKSEGDGVATDAEDEGGVVVAEASDLSHVIPFGPRSPLPYVSTITAYCDSCNKNVAMIPKKFMIVSVATTKADKLAKPEWTTKTVDVVPREWALAKMAAIGRQQELRVWVREAIRAALIKQRLERE